MAEMPHTQNQQMRAQKKESFGQQTYAAQDEFEFWDKLIMGEGHEDYQEIVRLIPTGYLDNDEMHLIRQLANELSTTEYIESRLNESLDKKIDLDNVKTNILRKMMFIVHSSKARQGFGIKAVGTQRVIQDEQVFQSMKKEKEPSALQKLKQKGGKAVDEVTGGGDVEYLGDERQDLWR